MLQMPERIILVQEMDKLALDRKNTEKYSEQQLMDACKRMEDCGVSYYKDDYRKMERLQQEFILNPLFIRVYKNLREKGVSDYELETWIGEACSINDSLTNYTEEQLMDAHSLSDCDGITKLEYIKYFSGESMTEDERSALLGNVVHFSKRNCDNRISNLSYSQRRLLLKDFLKLCAFSTEKTWEDLMCKLDGSQMLQDFLDFLQRKDVCFLLDENNAKQLMQLGADTPEKISRVYELLGSDGECMEKFLCLWSLNGFLQYELDWFCGKTEISEEERGAVLSGHAGYMNGIYKGQLDIHFEELAEYQQHVLCYAISHKKKRFQNLVADNFVKFSSLNRNSILFDPEFYKRCNLNTLTAAELDKCQGSPLRTSCFTELKEGEYTFNELHVLRYAEPVYRKFYNRLLIGRVDERLVVMKQLLKNNLLSADLQDWQLDVLAEKLSQKPLSVWREKRFSHISGVSMKDTLQFLIHFDILEKFLPKMHTKEEVLYADRNADQLQTYEDWEQVKKDIVFLDSDFEILKEMLNLSEEFVLQNKQHIERFLFSGGANLARIYYEYTPQKEAFRRIIQSVLMGRFEELKYFGDDLEREIGYPVSEPHKEIWKSDGEISSNGFTVLETGDFYTTLQIGVLPRRTCLSYQDGQHRNCLLAGFDSNKKILLAKKHGRVVGRAIIRLTKGMFHNPGSADKECLEFADLVNPGENSQCAYEDSEKLTLFLEVPYLAHITTEEEEVVKRLFVDYVTEKAGSLGALPVLAGRYSGYASENRYVLSEYFVCISRSKSGAQYLDSFSGSATVSEVGQYKKNALLVLTEYLQIKNE